MQVYAIRMFNFLRYGEKNNSIVFDITEEQKKDIRDGKTTMDAIYDDFLKDPCGAIELRKQVGIEGLIGISGIIDGNSDSSNGVGKSTVMESICYAHYGKIVRLSCNSDSTGEAGLSVVTRINGNIPENIKESWVEEIFESNGKIYRIKRGRTFSKNKKTSTPLLEFVCINEKLITSESGHRSKDTKRSIDDVNEMPYDLFVSSQMFGQNDAGKFLTGTDKTRKEMMISLLRMESLVHSCLKKVREKMSTQEKKVDSLNETIRVLESQALNSYKKFVTTNGDNVTFSNVVLSSFSLAISSLIEDINISIHKLEKEIKDINDKENELKQTNEITILQKIKEEGVGVKQEKERKEKELKEQTATWNSLLNDALALIEKKKKDLLSIESSISSTNDKITKSNGIIVSFDRLKYDKAIEKSKKAKEVRPKYDTAKIDLDKRNVALSGEIGKVNGKIEIESASLSKMISQKKKADGSGMFQCPECGSVVDVNHIDSKINEQKSKIDTYKADITRLENEHKELIEKIRDVDSKIEKINMFISEEAVSTKKISEFENEKLALERHKSSLLDLEKSKASIQEEIKGATTKKNELEAKIYEISSKFDVDIKTLDKRLSELRVKHADASKIANEISEKINKLAITRSEKNKEKSKLSERVGEINKEAQTFKENYNNLASIKSDMEKEKKLLSRYYVLEGVFGLDGVQTRIVKKYLPLLNIYIKEFLDILSDSNLQVKMSINDKSEVDMAILGGTADNYKMLSGGEKTVVRLAVDIGLALLSFSRSAKKPEIICLDEIFGCLDNSNINAVFKMLQHLQDKFSRILIITHKSEIKDMLPTNIVIEKNGGISALSEIKYIE